MKYKMIRNTGKAVVCMLLVVLLAGSGAGCVKTLADEEGTGSRIGKLLDGISEETGLHLDCSMEQDGVSISMDMYQKGDDFYADIVQDDIEAIMIADADYLAVMDPETRTYDILVIEDDIEAQLQEIKSNFGTILNIEGNVSRNYTEGTAELDGIEYVTEEYEMDGQRAVFAFDADDVLHAMIVDTGDEQIVLNIRSLDGDVPDGQFQIPEDYAYIGETEGDTGLETESEEDADISEYAVFSSDIMDFSFLYSKAHRAYITDTGAAELAINGDESLVGLSVSCFSDLNMPEVDELLEEKSSDVKEKYQDVMVDLPEIDTVTIEGHVLDGMIYAYSDAEGRTVDCSYFIEVRDGRYITYETAALRDSSRAELEAMGEALATLETDASYYDDMGFEVLTETADAVGIDDEDWDDIDWDAADPDVQEQEDLDPAAG